MENFSCISVQQAHEIMATKDVTIVDIRDKGSFAQGHIDHAQSVNEENINAFLQETDKNKPLICYCYHGISSQRAAAYFEAQGFKQVYSLDGGWVEWSAHHG